LYIKQIDFRNKRFAWSSLFYPQNLSLLVLSLVGAFFLITASLFLRDPFNKLGDALKGLGLGGGGEAASEKSEKNIIELHTESAGATSGKNDDEHPSEGAALPFAFIRERHLSDLAFLLKDKPLQDAAVVVNYLGPELANIFLEHFPEEKRIEIALSLSTVDINPGKTRALEEKIREDLDFVVGGERKLAAFLNAADEDVREKIIARLEKKDAASAQRLRLHVRDLESFLRDMPASGIAILYRHVNAALFAQILKATSAEVQQKVFGSLSAGAGERLKQELDLSRPLSPARLKKERQNIAAIIRRLIKEGHVEVENN
jgi:flagellar motor switch protein FliG